jgi:hypothetical protein
LKKTVNSFVIVIPISIYIFSLFVSSVYAGSAIGSDISSDGQLNISGTSTFSGKVAIGTTSPEYPLTIKSSIQDPIVLLDNGPRSNFIEFKRDNRLERGSIGALGNFEMNISYNMDYGDTVHRYYNSLKNAFWIAMQDDGVFLQFAPKNYVGTDDIWSNQNSLVMLHIDADGHTGLGKRNRNSEPIATLELWPNTEDVQSKEGIRVHHATDATKINYFSRDQLAIKNTNSNEYTVQLDATNKSFLTGGNVGIGTTTPATHLQVTATTTNATSTLTVGKTGQTKGSCIELFDSVGTAQYISVQNGALVVSTTSCK